MQHNWERNSIIKELQIKGMCKFISTDEAIYNSIDAISQSDLKELKRSPRHCLVKKNRRLYEDDSSMTPAKLIGKAIHKAFLEKDDFENWFVEKPQEINRRTKEGKIQYEEFINTNKGRLILDEKEVKIINSVREAINGHPLISELFQGGTAETSLIAKYPYLKSDKILYIKSRLDYWREDMNTIIDLKTTMDAGTKSFQRDIFKYGYHIQAAFYCDIVALVTGRMPNFLIVAVEKSLPFGIKVYKIPKELIDIARVQYQEWLDLYTKCYNEGSWPCYSNEISTVEIPDFLIKDLF